MLFSATSTRDGIIQLIERDTNTQSATTGSYPLKVKTVDVNEALGNYFLLAIKAGGRFQVDDTNQTDMPVITTSIVSGQADYQFVTDGSSTPNQILDLRQVRIKDVNGNWKTLKSIDREVDNITKYQGLSGEPVEYDITANEIILYPTPNYNSSGGIEFYISRTPSYFVSTDTTKEAGIPKIFQAYLHLRPSAIYCVIKNLPQAKNLMVLVQNMERAIGEYYSRRDRVDKKRLTPACHSTR